MTESYSVFNNAMFGKERSLKTVIGIGGEYMYFNLPQTSKSKICNVFDFGGYLCHQYRCR